MVAPPFIYVGNVKTSLTNLIERFLTRIYGLGKEELSLHQSGWILKAKLVQLVFSCTQEVANYFDKKNTLDDWLYYNLVNNEGTKG